MSDERILVVDDDPSLLTLLQMRLKSMGFTVTSCGTGRDALSRAQEEAFDFAILDLRLPDSDGLGLMEELHHLHSGLPVLILTAHGCIPNAVEAMQKGAYGYLTKPFDDKELLASIDKALTQQRMSQEIHRLQMLVNELYGMDKVVARSSEMQALLQQVARVAGTDATVCISGETGTGKEVIARVIHCNSSRANKSFIAVNCAAIPETLFESELFGHQKGSFTGAHQNKKGLFHTADKGTLFLDEIGELSYAFDSMAEKLENSLLEIKNKDDVIKQQGDLLLQFSDYSEKYCVCLIDIVNSTKITADLSDTETSIFYKTFLNSIASIVLSVIPLIAPCQPACAAPIICASGSAKRTGAQSAVIIPNAISG